MPAEIAQDVSLSKKGLHEQAPEPARFELWVESQDGLVGGYIDRVTQTKDGIVLSRIQKRNNPRLGIEEGSAEIKRVYKEHLKLYSALYRLKRGAWPIRLKVVPIQGRPVEVVFEPEESERLLSEAITFLHISNARIAEVKNRRVEIIGVASRKALHCRICLFRPACQAYWSNSELKPQE